MEITQIRVFPVEEDKLKAFVSIVFDDCFVISDIKIIQGNSGLFVSMPSKKRKNGTFRDIAHPLNNETRRKIEDQIIDEFRRVVAESGGDSTTPVRELSDEDPDDDANGDGHTARDTFKRRDYLEPPFEHPGG
jgi:stage V sporulation protein G